VGVSARHVTPFCQDRGFKGHAPWTALQHRAQIPAARSWRRTGANNKSDNIQVGRTAASTQVTASRDVPSGRQDGVEEFLEGGHGPIVDEDHVEESQVLLPTLHELVI